MAALLGVSASPSTRGNVLLHAIGRDWNGAMFRDLGDVALLTSTRRAAMIATRERLRGGS